MSNTTTIMGRLGTDPEVRFTASGIKVTNILVATSSKRGGNEETIWWRVTLWSDRFDKMMTYLKKGSAVVITGEISKKPEIYTDRNGSPQVSNLELTAEMIRFSPFGRSEGDTPARAAEGVEATGGFSAGQANATASTADAPFSEANVGADSFNENSELPF